MNNQLAFKLIERYGELNLTPIPPANIQLNGLSVVSGAEFFLQISLNNGGIISPSLMIYNGEARKDIIIPLTTNQFEGKILQKLLLVVENYADQPLPNALGAAFAKEISNDVFLEIKCEEHLPQMVRISIDDLESLFAEEVIEISELEPFLHLNGGQN
jgi:hypothetical protein